MNSLILQMATGFLQPLLMLFSLYLLVSGHNRPGGGFTGGLIAASGFILHAIAHDVKTTKRNFLIPPSIFLAAGFLAAVVSGMVGFFKQKPFMTAQWTKVSIPLLGSIKLGTPLLFELGVYLVVFGAVLMIFFNLEEKNKEQ